MAYRNDSKFASNGRSAALRATIALCVGLVARQTCMAETGTFFRIMSSTNTVITSFSLDGYITWSNAEASGTCEIQASHDLTDTNGWERWTEITVTDLVSGVRLFDPQAATGMVYISEGPFMMGNNTNVFTYGEGGANEVPYHQVQVSAFSIDRYEVTKGLWDSVYAWATNNGYSLTNALGNADDQPVHNLSWYDALKWCNARSEMENLTPCYYTNTSQTVVYRTGDVDVPIEAVNWTASGYRLPTEAEWEKAARGGASGRRFPWSDADTIAHTRANYYAYTNNIYTYENSLTSGYHPSFTNASPPSSPVGYFAANGYGLYDMAGNMAEWCWDTRSDTYYATSPVQDPRGPATGSNGYRWIRGGSLGSDASNARVSRRNYFLPTDRSNTAIGFRTVRSAAP